MQKTHFMKDKKKIAVFGATGAQGGGLAHAILNDPDSDFAVRAITRNTTSEKAKALLAAGAEVVEADLDDESSIERALNGCYGAFCVTFFWNHFSPEKEKEHARNMAAAAAKTGVEHVIWSTLEDIREFIPLSDNRMPTLLDAYKVPHFDGKGESDKFFYDAGVPVTLLYTSFYWDNFIHFGMGPKKSEDGTLVINIPMADQKIAGIAAEDIGKCAYGIFKTGKSAIGKKIGIASDHLTGSEISHTLSAAFGEQVSYQPLTHTQYRELGFPGADDLGNMFQFYCEFNEAFTGIRDISISKVLNPRLKSFAEWASENWRLIPQ
jgi:uncharacterized protein YbjT (DUF2867 family)